MKTVVSLRTGWVAVWSLASCVALILALLTTVGCFPGPKSTPTPAIPAVTTFHVGSRPSALAFDGERLWITNSGDGTVSSLRRDGGVIGVYRVGRDPGALAYGGGYLWVANRGDDTVTQLTLSGQTLNTFDVGEEPANLLFWEDALWVVSYNDGVLTKFSAEGKALASIPAGRHPRALATSPGYIWTASQADSTLTKVDREGVLAATYNASASPSPAVFDDREAGPAAMAFDGTFLWAVFPEMNALTRFDERGAAVASYPQQGGPQSLVAGANSLWTANALDGTVTRLDNKDGFPLVTFPVGQTPVSLIYDGASLWVANQADNSVVRIDP